MATALLERNSTNPDDPNGRGISDAELQALTGISNDRLQELADMVRNEHERRGIPVGLPDNMPSTQDLEARRTHEAEQSSEDRKAELREQLASQRADLVAIAARRSGRAYSRKNGALNEEYENSLATHNTTFIALTKLEHPEWNLTGQETVEEANQKTAAATMHYMEHLKELRDATSEELQGTRIGKIVRFMNSGGRLKKFAKYAGFGLLAAGAGAAIVATGAVGGVVIGGAIGGAARFARGAMRAEGDRIVGEGVGRRGKKNKAAHDSDIFEQALKTQNGKLDLAEAGAAALATIFNKDVKDQQSQRRRSLGWGAFSVAAGAGVGYLAGMAADKIGFGDAKANAAPQAGQEGGPTPGSAAHANLADRQSVLDFNQMMDNWIYKPGENPFYAPGKTGIHDLGPALKADAALDAGKPAGWNDLTQNRWMNSPEQFASICAAFGLDGMADEAGAINGLADRFKLDPMVYQDKHEAVMGILNKDTTKIEGPIPIQSTISSEYGVDMGNGNMDLAKDEYVDNHPKGTKMIITYKDEVTGAYRTIELRCECGGQRMVEHPMPVYEPVSVPVAPQGGGEYAPQGGGNPEYAQEQPQYTEPEQEQPQGGGNPPTTTPPTTTPPTTTPPTTTPPKLDEKVPSQDHNANPGLAIIKQMGDILMGSGAPQSENQVTTPGPKYTNPLGTMGSNPSAGGAGGADTSPGSLGAHNNAPPAQGGSTGTGTGGRETGRVNE